ncbi:MAG: AMP-binding protein [Acidobacteria bacterium]|nr:AMP-binding protein [Acidobacteriota bacterium]MCB9397485.1 AMP-binding protein [Acidobacteriota bacterium]
MMRGGGTVPVRFRSIGQFLADRAKAWAAQPVLLTKNADRYEPLSWQDFYSAIQKAANGLCAKGFGAGNKLAFFTPNSLEMLVLEMAAMSIGMISIPLFSGYKEQMFNDLIAFCEADALVVPGQTQQAMLGVHPSLKCLITLTPTDLSARTTTLSYQDLLNLGADQETPIPIQVNRDDIALIMFTSGTMSFPKGVQLTHGNILSQQEALDFLWQTQPGGRLLSYLPWHHSFGGIFEKFFGLYSGTALALDDSRGKDIPRLVANWKAIKPMAFFSVPKIFQELVSYPEPGWRSEFFHRDLRFVFTAGAPLPGTVSDVFIQNNIPVLEGWGLTETSPCCTLTDGKTKRVPNVVGFPIPGVEIRLDSDGEILVNGPNVMPGYYQSPERNARIFTEDGFFRTGDLGEITPEGLKILTRKDRLFKLANAEKVNPTVIENQVLGHCPFVKHLLVLGSGQKNVSALVFPNKEMMASPRCSEPEGCKNPQDSGTLSACLRDCIDDLNARLRKQYESIACFVILDQELELDKGELTPSLKVNPQTVMKNYATYIEPLFDPSLEKPAGAIYVQVGDQGVLV